jgi:hypothetical protein
METIEIIVKMLIIPTIIIDPTIIENLIEIIAISIIVIKIGISTSHFAIITTIIDRTVIISTNIGIETVQDSNNNFKAVEFVKQQIMMRITVPDWQHHRDGTLISVFPLTLWQIWLSVINK